MPKSTFDLSVKPSDALSIQPFFSTDHKVNWYVYRSPSIRKQLKSLWGRGPEDKSSFAGMNLEQKIVTRANALFHALEEDGPKPRREWFSITHDSRHGRCNRPDLKCVTKGFYHAHVTDSGQTYEVMWECFEEQKLINIVAMGYHENFDFKRKHHDSVLALSCAKEAAQKAKFSANKRHQENKIRRN